MPLLWISLAFLAGILLAANVHLSTYAWLLLAGVALALGLLSRLTFHASRITPHISRLTHYVSRLTIRFSHFTDHASRFTSSLPPLPYSLIPLFLFLGAARYQFAQPDLAGGHRCL
jgi:hypothetical protein